MPCSTTGVTSGSLPTRAATRRGSASGAGGGRSRGGSAKRLRAAHRRVDAVAPRFVVRRRDDTAAVRVAADDQRLRAELRPVEAPPPPRRTRPGRHGRRSLWRRSLTFGTDATPTCHRCGATVAPWPRKQRHPPRRRRLEGRRPEDVDEGLEPRRRGARRRSSTRWRCRSGPASVASPRSCSCSRTRAANASFASRHRGHGSARTRDVARARPRKAPRCAPEPSRVGGDAGPWRALGRPRASAGLPAPLASGQPRPPRASDRERRRRATRARRRRRPSPATDRRHARGAASGRPRCPQVADTCDAVQRAVHVRLVAEDDLRSSSSALHTARRRRTRRLHRA